MRNNVTTSSAVIEPSQLDTVLLKVTSVSLVIFLSQVFPVQSNSLTKLDGQEFWYWQWIHSKIHFISEVNWMHQLSWDYTLGHHSIRSFRSFYIFLTICLKYCLWGRTFMYLFEIQILYKHIPDETKLFFFLPFLLWDVYSDWNKQSKVPSFSCLPIPFVLVILKRHFGDDAL